MHEKTVRTLLFAALLLAAPALLTLIQAVFVLPPVFLLAGTLVMLVKTIEAPGSENVTFLAFFAVHFLVFAGLYWLVAFLVAKLGARFLSARGRTVLLGVCLAGLAALTQAPLFGGAGDGPMRLGPLQFLLADLARSYGTAAVIALYLVFPALFAVLLAWRRRRGGGAASEEKNS